MAHFNLLAYFIYAILTYFITVRVGLIFHKNGFEFIREELRDAPLATSVNNLLLACYYLTNLGYITFKIWFWEKITNYQTLLESICSHVGTIILTLGLLHFMNMFLIYWMRNRVR
jgi:hypothetical protein